VATKAVNLEEAKKLLEQFWSPKVIGSINDQYVKIAKGKGDFPWHSHEHEDELFLVISGQLTVHREPSDGGTLTPQSRRVLHRPPWNAACHFCVGGDLPVAG
jgi:mannose-6-phosphate isomerase-like protein (cupin superfamily)